MSVIFGERLSVRLPRRTVPICVSEPMGLAMPLRMARTPAMNVVLTAPSPTSRTPSFPRAGAIATGVDTGENYISFQLSAISSQLVAESCKLRAVRDVREAQRSAHARRRHDRRE